MAVAIPNSQLGLEGLVNISGMTTVRAVAFDMKRWDGTTHASQCWISLSGSREKHVFVLF
jgi:hypothetical protein